MSDTQPVNRFVNLEARVDDTSDREGDSEGDSEDSNSASFLILIYGVVFLNI